LDGEIGGKENEFSKKITTKLPSALSGRQKSYSQKQKTRKNLKNR
jgi:hypothetical protein